MNKNTLRFVLLITFIGMLLSGCQRLQKTTQDFNQNPNSSPTSAVPVLPTTPALSPQQQPTPLQPTSVASLAPSATPPALQPTKAPAATQTKSQSSSQSDQLLNDLDNSLNNLSNSLNSVDTIKSIP
ncbi:MAG TPA: hypothetical protein VKF38_03020 [Anaerolineaceae bacterium]|nr:hypothetical protein [Anaerolineaceae bacterium]